jgi:membrane protein involved in colicin uptake
MLDKMGALGLISVFDIEEVGVPVLTQEIGMDDALADQVVVACHEKGKVVAEEQRIAAEAEAARKAADAAATDHLLGGMGGMGGAAAEPDAGAESAADSILGGGG